MSRDYAIALSRFSLSIDEFLQLTPLEFFLALKDQQNIDLFKVRTISNSIRLSTWYLLNVQLKRRINRPEKLFSVPGDGEVEKRKPQTKDQMKNVMRAIAADTKHRKKRNIPQPAAINALNKKRRNDG